MHFCPLCESLLLLHKQQSEHVLKCRFCPYHFPLRQPMEDVISFGEQRDFSLMTVAGEAARPKTDTNCPKCGHGKAYFAEMQTRSADEAATVFYQCVACEFNWKEN